MNYISYIIEANDLANNGDYQEAIDYFKENKLDNHIKYLVYKKEDLDDTDRKFIKESVIFLQNIYNNSFFDSPLPDYDFDTLYEINKKHTGEDYVGSVMNTDTGIYHEYPDLRGSLDKIHFITDKDKGNDNRKSLEGWIKSISNRYRQNSGRELNLNDVSILIMPKFDGVSVILELKNSMLQRALLRGEISTNKSDDISHLFNDYQSGIDFVKDISGEYGIKTEIIMTDENFEKICKKVQEFSSPRSAVVSILSNTDKNYIKKTRKYLTTMPLQAQNKLTGEIEFNTFSEYMSGIQKITDLKSIKSSIDNIQYVMEKKGIPIDGVVLRIVNKEVCDILGRRDDSGINNFDVAYKFPPPKKYTKLKEIDFSLGKFGNLTPVAKIDPVVLNGNVIMSVSIGSVDRLRKLALSRNDEVIITYDIIPYLNIDETCKRSGKKLIKIPTHCPVCNQELFGNEELKCINEACPVNIKGQIHNYVTKMGIKNISHATIDTFYEFGVLESIEDLYSLEKSKKILSYKKGFGEKSINNIIKSIDSRRTVKDYELLGSIGIEGISKTLFKSICKEYSVKDILEISLTNNSSALIALKGIQQKTAEKIIEGIHKNRRLIKFLLDELHITSSSEDNVTADTFVTFTKIRDSAFEEFLLTKGIATIELSKSKTKMLIVPDSPINSLKLSRARSWNIPVMAISEAYKAFGFKK